MTCGCKPVRQRGALYFQNAAKQSVKAPQVEVAGTWDFKWPLGTQIRVAFQRLPPETQDTSGSLDKVRAEIIRLAARWPIEVEAPGMALPERQVLVTGIRLSFLDGWLDAPLGSNAVLGAEHHSPFLPDDETLLTYDVLISLEDLPLARVDPFRYRGDPHLPVTAASEPGRERVLLPLSEIGSYARRVDYGAPTLFLGRFGKLRSASLLAHFGTNVGQHVVVHEFGHVLGLAHEHQNPRYDQRPYRSAEEVARRVGARFQLSTPLTEDEVRDQVIDPWPGSLEFSDWAKPEGSLYDLNSVMTYPYHADLLQPPAAKVLQLATVQGTSVVSVPASDDYPALVAPTATDIANLRAMYERPPNRRRSEPLADKRATSES